MNNLRKLIGIISKVLFALILALALINITSCDNMLGLLGSSQGNGQGNEQPSNPNDNEPAEPAPLPTSYHDYENFNPDDYVIENETGRPDSELAFFKDLVWFMYAENENAGEWTANYIKTNKIKTILAEDSVGWAWTYPDQLDRYYVNMDAYSWYEGIYKEYDGNKEYYDIYRADLRKDMYRFFTHETMHLIQYKSDAFNLMTGMRPDICAAIDMLTEFLTWFYTEKRSPGTYITADMANAVETQSKYMIVSTDPWEYPAARTKDPSLPEGEYGVHGTPWFNNELSGYTQHAFGSALVRENSMTPPLRRASKEDVLKVARTLLACRDPKMAGVTDETLWTVCEALRKVAIGESKYLRLTNGVGGNAVNAVNQDLFNNFQDIIANWDAEYAAQQAQAQ